MFVLLGSNEEDGDNSSKPCFSRRAGVLRNDFQGGLVVDKSTAVLWGRRVKQVALSSSNAIALTDLGELFVWGSHKKKQEGIHHPKSIHLVTEMPVAR